MNSISKRIAVVAIAAAFGLGLGPPQGAVAKPDGERVRIEQQLTPEQQATFKKIMEENRAATADTRKVLDAKKDELEAQMKSETPDKAKIEALCAEIGVLRGKLLAAKVDVRAQLKKEGLPTKFFDKEGKGPRKGDRENMD